MISVGIGAHDVAGVASADPCRLHPAVGGEVGGTEAETLDPRRRGADRLDVGDAASRLEDGVEEDRPADSGLRFELGDEAVGVVDVLGTLDLGDHDHVEAVTDLGDGGGEVVEHPRRVESVDAGPELACRRASQALPISISPARAASLSLAGTPSSRLASSTSTVGAIAGTLATIFGFDGGRKWIIRDGRTGISRSGSGAPAASGRKKSLGGRIGAPAYGEAQPAHRQSGQSRTAVHGPVGDHEAVGDQAGDDRRGERRRPVRRRWRGRAAPDREPGERCRRTAVVTC